MYFWRHQFREESTRAVNQGEANMVAAFVSTFLATGIAPQRLTILSAYKHQMLHLRELLSARGVSVLTPENSVGVAVLTIDQVGPPIGRNGLVAALSLASSFFY